MEARYLAVAESLSAELVRLAPNTVLATEQQLARRFGVSRVTVRQALGVLERGGLLSRQRGRGTIVSPPKVVRSLTPITTIDEDLRRQGVDLETRVLQFERDHAAPAAIRALLGSGQQSGLAFLSLLRLVDDRVIAYDRCYFPMEFADGFDPHRPMERSVLETIRLLAGGPPTWVDWEIEIEPGPKEAVAALRITPGLPVVVATSTLRRNDGCLVVRADRFYRIDRVKFRHSGRYPSVPASPEPPGPAVIR